MNAVEIKELWNRLTDYTHTYGQENEVIDIINDFINIPFQKDEYGNYYVIVGDSDTMLVTHLDNAVKQKLKVTKVTEIINNREFIKTDGFTILGADDKTGIVIMINMILNNIPGNYYFFIGEEVGLIGSLLYYKEKKELLSKFKRCIAFDRKGYGSIIVRQKGRLGCSNEFSSALSNEFKRNGMKFKEDLNGIGTDSASFFGDIPECVNLSVGYFNEHTYNEKQDMDYMVKMCDAVINIRWENLPTVRIPKNWNTKKPMRVIPEENHLPIYKLQNIFSEIQKLFRSKLKANASAHSLFEPEKQMRFYQVSDLDKLNNFNLWLSWDGSVKIKKGEKLVKYDNYEDLFKILNKNNKKIRNLIGIVKLPEEILADQERVKIKIKKLKNKTELTSDEEKELINLEKEFKSFDSRIISSKDYNNQIKETKVKSFSNFVLESYSDKYGKYYI